MFLWLVCCLFGWLTFVVCLCLLHCISVNCGFDLLVVCTLNWFDCWFDLVCCGISCLTECLVLLIL